MRRKGQEKEAEQGGKEEKDEERNRQQNRNKKTRRKKKKSKRKRKKRPIAYHTYSPHSGKAAASPGCMPLLQARPTAGAPSLLC